jgi:hypothetical protein
LPNQFELRIYNVKVWAPLSAATASPLNPVRVGIMDFLGVNTTTAPQGRLLEEFTRYPDQVRRAGIGFRYPIAQSDLVLQEGQAITLITYSSNVTTGLAMFQVSWRLEPNSPVSKFWLGLL